MRRILLKGPIMEVILYQRRLEVLVVTKTQRLDWRTRPQGFVAASEPRRGRNPSCPEDRTILGRGYVTLSL